MHKIILITGATDGIGFETAKRLAAQGHDLLIHGRNPDKLSAVKAKLANIAEVGRIESYRADFAKLSDVEAMADAILADHSQIDIVINNAGVYKTRQPRLDNGFDTRFVVNLLAPITLTMRLLSIIPKAGRIINLSSAAQAPVNLSALRGETELGDMPAYAQSKLAFTMWTRHMANTYPEGPLFSAVNPGSLLNTNMVKDGWGGSDNDISIGVDILTRAALSEEFEGHSGDYFDNDSGRFAPPHPDGLDKGKINALISVIDEVLSKAS